MAQLIRQLECLHCSHNRYFVVHTETAQRLLTQAELRDLPRDAHLTCARCGSASLISAWSDGNPYAARDIVPRRRRKQQAATNP
jgi:transcription elongation factor Elf1